MIFAFIRILSFFLASNIIFPTGTPKLFKVFISLILSILTTLNTNIDIVVNDLYTLINYTGIETTTGLLLGYITSICFNVLKMGGKLIDQQLGLSMANIYDSQSNTQSTLIENLLYWLGIMVFFQINGHHVLINSIQHSFEIISIGKPIIESNMEYILNVFSQYFILGIKISVPIIIALIISEVIMGLISRSVPQLNVMILGMPLKILVGTMFIIIALPFVLKEIHSLFNMLPSVLDGTLVESKNIIFPVGILLSTGDKTEEPTNKKKKDERKKGNVAKSKEIVNAITLCGVILTIYTMSGFMINETKKLISSFLTIDMNTNLDYTFVSDLINNISFTFIKMFLPIGIVTLLLGVLANIIQTGLLLNTEGLKPKLSKINPINGFKNMFSMKALGNMAKSILIIIVLSYIGYSFIKKNFSTILKSGDLYFPYLLYWIIDIIKSLLSVILIAVIVIAIIDFVYESYNHKKGLKMTKQEIKEEYKQMEGDPNIKGKIKQKQRQLASQRMMQSVPSATVIVTNPTHLSIAIRYEKSKDSAPVVVAKGADHVAMKIREIANENDIPLIENKPLARMIYKKVDINNEIPSDMYELVAEVLVAVYKIKNSYKFK